MIHCRRVRIGLVGSPEVGGAQVLRKELGPAPRSRAIVLRKQASGSNGGARGEASVPSLVRASHGRPLDQGTRSVLEGHFGHDLSRVRVHTDAPAAAAARGLHAKAFTLGENIYFNRGFFSPHTSEGIGLLGHEAAHVVQGYRGEVTGAASSPMGGLAVGGSRRHEAFAEEHERRLRARRTPGEQSRIGSHSVLGDLGAARPRLEEIAAEAVKRAEELLDRRGLNAEIDRLRVDAKVNPGDPGAVERLARRIVAAAESRLAASKGSLSSGVAWRAIIYYTDQNSTAHEKEVRSGLEARDKATGGTQKKYAAWAAGSETEKSKPLAGEKHVEIITHGTTGDLWWRPGENSTQESAARLIAGGLESDTEIFVTACNAAKKQNSNADSTIELLGQKIKGAGLSNVRIIGGSDLVYMRPMKQYRSGLLIHDAREPSGTMDLTEGKWFHTYDGGDQLPVPEAQYTNLTREFGGTFWAEGAKGAYGSSVSDKRVRRVIWEALRGLPGSLGATSDVMRALDAAGLREPGTSDKDMKERVKEALNGLASGSYVTKREARNNPTVYAVSNEPPNP